MIKRNLAGDQTVDTYNQQQFELYLNLIREEVGELEYAYSQNDREKILDGLMDIIVVVAGAAHSLGCDATGAWNEVIRSNMSKVDAATGKILKREDGKILKPATFSPANFKEFIHG